MLLPLEIVFRGKAVALGERSYALGSVIYCLTVDITVSLVVLCFLNKCGL